MSVSRKPGTSYDSTLSVGIIPLIRINSYTPFPRNPWSRTSDAKLCEGSFIGLPLESKRSTGIDGGPEELGLAGVGDRDGDRDGGFGGMVDELGSS